jgi:hypothetical protein
MGTTLRLLALAGLGLLAACTRWVDDGLAVRSIYGGLEPMPVYQGELPEVLWSAPNTPDRQNLLYVSMVEAEVASQYAGRALAAEDPLLMRSALGEVLYALDPDAAPGWEAKSTGIVRGWAGTGYGLRRAATEMGGAIRAGAADSDASAALADYGPPAARCVDNALARAERLVALSREAFDGAAIQSQPLLRQIQDLADQLSQGGGAAAADVAAEDPECGLRHALRYLDRLGPRRG